MNAFMWSMETGIRLGPLEEAVGAECASVVDVQVAIQAP